MHPVSGLIDKPKRIVAGLMSGTSLDGVDAAIVRLNGSGRGLEIELLAFVSQSYEPALRNIIRDVSEVATSDVRTISQLEFALAHRFADAVEAALQKAGLGPNDLDLIGSHGQTIHHVPIADDLAGRPTRSTLQIGDAAALALRLDTPVVSDFRSADVALGGQGAPLAPYFDDAFFASDEETRGLLNLGGIANLTVLPKGAGPGTTIAFDTGPANMLIDALAQRLFEKPYDSGGQLAGRGAPDEALLESFLSHPYFQLEPPKSTGRELFGSAFVERLIAEGPNDSHDLIATASALTARSIHKAYEQFLEETNPLDVLIASGGGVHNDELMRQLSRLFDPIPVRTTTEFGLDADAKEAILFGVLAHEWVNGVATNMPSVTGASRPTLLGSLTLP